MYTQQIKNHFFSSKSYEYADTRKNVDVCEKKYLKSQLYSDKFFNKSVTNTKLLQSFRSVNPANLQLKFYTDLIEDSELLLQKQILI